MSFISPTLCQNAPAGIFLLLKDSKHSSGNPSKLQSHKIKLCRITIPVSHSAFRQPNQNPIRFGAVQCPKGYSSYRAGDRAAKKILQCTFGDENLPAGRFHTSHVDCQRDGKIFRYNMSIHHRAQIRFESLWVTSPCLSAYKTPSHR